MDNFNNYRNANSRVSSHWIKTEADLRKTLTDKHHRELLAKNGSWWLHVERRKAEAAGNHKRAKRLQAKSAARTKSILAKLTGAARRYHGRNAAGGLPNTTQGQLEFGKGGSHASIQQAYWPTTPHRLVRTGRPRLHPSDRRLAVGPQAQS